ncbi:FAD:protein FMN transferase [Parapedobacter indicus]|uniref:FAD:protein FMN transferase n=1 Tax=Parapedobacter indicus TaxID=1477437 RepID=A0A1I3R013_9SPHI|nr:FAD:protein FMN transferase [Parapedobacter indicus]PPL00302.1 thiamine biosynthesis lipoprotein [Parapedobacter indicus]SFJ39350.1 thiamine biosynthesis lipoprotein [Parapedobacter indicus]
MKAKWIFLIIGFACLFWAGKTTENLKKYTIIGYAQGTDYLITYYATDSCIHKNTIDSTLNVIDSSMSLYKPYSLINKINAGGQGVFELDDHFYNVLIKSFAIKRDSKGIFDVTVAPLVQLWGFGVKAVDHFPDSGEVRQALACTGMDKIRLRGHRLEKKSPCVQIDLNGIAQGYSVDVLAGLLEDRGIRHYVVELGGELRVKGPKPDGLPMRIGIERPLDGESGVVTINDVMEIREGAITTAGNYRKFLQDGKRKFSHHIDPRTGYPFDTGIISATIYAKDAVTADGYDNVIMAMEAEESITFVNKRKGLEVFVIYKDTSGTVRDTMSIGFKKLLAINK